MVDAYEWSLGMFPVREERLAAFVAIFLGLIFFCCIPGGVRERCRLPGCEDRLCAGVLAWMPYYHQLKGEGYSNQEIFVATLKLWWKHAMLWKRRLMRRWNKHCQPW